MSAFTTERRRSLETPFRHEHERSAEARMNKGIMPKALPELRNWYIQTFNAEVPQNVHKNEVWRDYGEHAEGGSALGSPAYSDPFRRYIENMPSELDMDGYFIRPCHAALSRLGRRKPLIARHLFRLAMSGGDWRRHADNIGWTHEEMELFISEALRLIWREYSEQAVRLS